MMSVDQGLDLALLVSLAFLASGAAVLMVGPRRWSALVRPLAASLLLAVVVPIVAVSVFHIPWNTTVLAMAVVAVAFIAALTRERRTIGPNDAWP